MNLKEIAKDVAKTYMKYKKEKPKIKQNYFRYELSHNNEIIDNTLCDTVEEAKQLKKELQIEFNTKDITIIKWKFKGGE